MSALTRADFHAGHCVGEYACEWAGQTSPNLCPLASDELFTTYRRLAAEWTPPEPSPLRSLADDPAACTRMLEHFKFLFGDMGRADALLLGNMAELIGAAETGEQ